MPSAVRSYFDLDKYDMGMDSDSDSEDSSFSEELKDISMKSLLGNHTGGADIPVELDSSSSSTSTSSKRDPQYHKVSLKKKTFSLPHSENPGFSIMENL